MDTNLALLIVTIILFILLVIFDFAFFRFREKRFEDNEPLSFLLQTTVRSLEEKFRPAEKPTSVSLESEKADSAVAPSSAALPAEAQVNATTTSGAAISGAPTEPPVVHVQVSADIPQGTVVYITMEVADASGRTTAQRTVLPAVTAGAPQAIRRPVTRLSPTSPLGKLINAIKIRLASLDIRLLWGAILAYAFIISFAINRFPIYFFTDEAIHMNMIADFLSNGFKNYDGEFLPTFFIKEGWVNGTSVYVQLLPYLIFGKSIIVTRLVSAFITLFGAIALGLLLKQVFKIKYYWAGIFLLLTTPAFFLHARTAFEYAEVAAFYCMFLYFYGRYRKGDMRALYFAVVAAALGFYTHGLGQILNGVTALALFITDFRYHIHPKRRKTIFIGLFLAILLLLPFARYYFGHPTEIAEQVKRRQSYWSDISLTTPQKILEFLGQYFYGLNPLYWYFPNNIDLDRHKMLGYNDGLIITLPFMLIGWYQLFRRIEKPLYRFGSIILIASPLLLTTIAATASSLPNKALAGQLTDIATNGLWVAAPLMLIGVFLALRNIHRPVHRLALIAWLACPIPSSVVAIGMPRMLWMSVPLAILTAVGLSSVLVWAEKQWRVKRSWAVPVGLFATLLLLALYMLRSALVDGPLWFDDYGLYGMQFGAEQVFQDTIRPLLEKDPNVRVVLSPSWANGTEQFIDFFIPQDLQPRLQLGRPENVITSPDVDTSNILFIATANEFNQLVADPKYQNISVVPQWQGLNLVNPIPYPNQQPGFYIITLQPSPNFVAIMNQQHEANREPIEDKMVFRDSQYIRVVHSPLGSGRMEDIFDNDPDTLARVEEANPFYIAIYPITPIDTHSVFIKTGSLSDYTVTIRLYAPGATDPVIYTQTYNKDVPPDPEIEITFDKGPAQAAWIEIEIKDNTTGETSQIHIRTIQFK